MRAATVYSAYFAPEHDKNDPVCRVRQWLQFTQKQEYDWQQPNKQELEDEKMCAVTACNCKAYLKTNREKIDRGSDVRTTAPIYKINQECNTSELSENLSDDLIAKEFVDRLLTEGCVVPCDETSDSFLNQSCLPPYYDRNLYKQGQQFFYKHIFGLFLSKLLGLIALLSLPLTLKILILTNMSSTPLTAYRRYMATILHMCIWYDEDFESEKSLRLWSSINKVRSMHNAASNKANAHYRYRINQMDMALTQFGFMGISLVRSEMVGVHNVSDLEWKGFIHLWRVVGYVLGIDDRFNICQDSVIHTKKICELLIQRVFLPHMRDTSPEFDIMSKALLNGMWVVNPVLQHDVFILYLHMVLENSKDYEKPRPNVRPLGTMGVMKLKIIIFVVWALHFPLVRVWYKFLQIVGLWFMRKLPFLAYYKFGKCVAHVAVD